MKIGSNLQFEVPDNCPDNCPMLSETFYQGNLCSRCPVFNCVGEVLLKPVEYRDDWAESFEIFFRDLDDLK